MGWQLIRGKSLPRSLNRALGPQLLNFERLSSSLCAHLHLTPAPHHFGWISGVPFRTCHRGRARGRWCRRASPTSARSTKTETAFCELRRIFTDRRRRRQWRVSFPKRIDTDQSKILTETVATRWRQCAHTKIIYKRNWNNLWFKKRPQAYFFHNKFCFALFSIPSSNCVFSSAASSHLQRGRSSRRFRSLGSLNSRLMKTCSVRFAF